MNGDRSTGGGSLQWVGFHADFLLCPVAIGALLVLAWMYSPLWEMGDVSLAFLLGAIGWTLTEYFLHRFVLHAVAPFRRLHALHHARPTALVGTPAWLSPVLAISVFVSIFHVGDVSSACGMTAGVMVGYLVYVFIHYATHHLPRLRWPWLCRLRRAHALHHRSEERPCNFGVSTGFWDAVFRTAVSEGSSQSPKGPARA